ncbi:MAG TPA: cytochrome c [Gammaproteobacteria bacterium]|nr:cytochrome c [Gammaproteobacteria bacterium]
MAIHRGGSLWAAASASLALVLVLVCGSASAEDLLARGKYLVDGPAACGECHSPRDKNGQIIKGKEFSGAYVITDPGFKAYAKNITPDKETGIGNWTPQQIARAVREGITPDGKLLGPPMSFEFYRNVSDSDIDAIVAYIMSVPPVRNKVPESVYYAPLPPNYGPPVGHVPEVPREDLVRYGWYLAGPMAHCMDCHTPRINGVLQRDKMGAGGDVFTKPFGLDFTAVSRNITPNPDVGIGKWTDADIKRAITQGISKDGSKLKAFMPFENYANMTPQDLDAIVAYLRSLPAFPPISEKKR